MKEEILNRAVRFTILCWLEQMDREREVAGVKMLARGLLVPLKQS